jgi:hypothetical protein
MAFNFKSFATAFMTDQARQINERVARAQEYEDEQRDALEASKATHKKRLAFVNNTVMSAVNNLKRLGASDAQIKAAVANGPETIFTFFEAVDQRAQDLDKTRLDKSEIDAIVDMPDTFEKDKYTLDQFIKSSYNLLEPSLGSTKDPDRTLLQKAFGVGLRDQVRANLDKEAEYGGYSIMDLNEMARQDAYESLVPGSPFRIMPGKTYDRMSVYNMFTKAVEGVDDALKEDPIYTDLRSRDAVAAAQYRQSKMFPMVQMFVKDYKKPFLNDNDLYQYESLISPQQLATIRMSIDSEELEREFMSRLLEDGGNTFIVPYTKQDGTTGKYKFTIDPNSEEVIEGFRDNQPIASNALQDIFEKLLYSGTTFTKIDASGKPISKTPEALGDPRTLTEENFDVSDRDIRDNILPARPLTPESRKIAEQLMRSRFGSLFTVGTDPSDNYTDLYTREQYESMTSRQRRERNLPVSIIGAKQFYFRDEIEDLFIDEGVYDTLEGVNIKLNPTENNYKVNIKGMIGTFNVTKEQLDALPLSVFEGVDPIVTIDRYGEGEELARKKISSSVINRLSRGKVTEEEQEDKDVVEEQTVDTDEEIRYTESNPLDLKSMSEEEALEAYEKLKVGEYYINPFDGRVLPKR